MKLLMCVLAAGWVFTVGCSPEAGIQSGRDGSVSTAPVVTGWVTPEEIIRSDGHAAFKARYDTVAIENPLVEMLGKLSAGTDVLVFYGSWCGDSRREVPRFIRIMEQGGFARERVRFLALDRTKKSPDGLTEQYAIERVPTFVLLRGGKEIGRVVELPRSTLEGDLIEILVGALKR